LENLNTAAAGLQAVLPRVLEFLGGRGVQDL
jgi:hypothetical protein